MRIRWLARAIRHVIEIRNYIAVDNPVAAENVGRRLVDASRRLADAPGMGRAGRATGTRELVVAGTPYVIVYRVKENAIEIIAVLHGARKWPDSFP
jgi:toxin ParE1/3/4